MQSRAYFELALIRLDAGMGVEAARAKTLEELARLLTSSFKRNGPFLIELVIT